MTIDLVDKGIAITCRPDKPGEDTGLSLEDKIKKVQSKADYVEIKQDDIVDYIDSGHLNEILEVLKKFDSVYYIFTINRPIEADYTTKIDQRTIDEVEQFLPHIDILDVDFNYILKHHDPTVESCIEKAIREAKHMDILVKGSYHDYTGPSTKKKLTDIQQFMYEKGVDIYKFCTTARKGYIRHILPVLNKVYDISHNKDEDGVQRKVVGWAMGEQGRPSRILTWLIGGKYTFVKPPWGQPSADGQVLELIIDQVRDDTALLDKALQLWMDESYGEACTLIEDEINKLEGKLKAVA